MYMLRDKKKEFGLSLIESSLVIVLSGIVVVLIQAAISNIIKQAVHENALHDVSYVMDYIQDTLQTSCNETDNECGNEIASLKTLFNKSKKIQIDIVKNKKNVSVFVLYALAKNEDFGNLLMTHASAYYGRMNASNTVVSSVLGWWRVETNGTIFSARNNDNSLFFFNNFRVETKS